MLIWREWAEIPFASCQRRGVLRWRKHVVVEVKRHRRVEVVLIWGENGQKIGRSEKRNVHA
jgi:hypothetical protein